MSVTATVGETLGCSVVNDSSFTTDSVGEVLGSLVSGVGEVLGVLVACIVGELVGSKVTCAVGELVGSKVTCTVGELVGVRVTCRVGELVGSNVTFGDPVGSKLLTAGTGVPVASVSIVGDAVTSIVGDTGEAVGEPVTGDEVTGNVGAPVGLRVGVAVGASVVCRVG